MGELKTAIEDFRALGGEVLEISGGEPIAHPALHEVVGFGVSLGLELRIYTSGVLALQGGIARPPSRDFWVALRERGVSRLYFNVQGPNSDVHESVTRIPGSFAAMSRSLLDVAATGLFTGVHFVPMKNNWRHLEETIGVAVALGAKEFAVLRFVPQGRGLDNRDDLMLSESEYWDFVERSSAARRKHLDILVRLGCPFNNRALLGDVDGLVPCKAGVEVLHVRPNGDVVPCSAFQQGLLPLGNLKEEGLAVIYARAGDTLQQELGYNSPKPGTIHFIEEVGDACLAQIKIGATYSPPEFLPRGNEAKELHEEQLQEAEEY